MERLLMNLPFVVAGYLIGYYGSKYFHRWYWSGKPKYRVGRSEPNKWFANRVMIQQRRVFMFFCWWVDVSWCNGETAEQVIELLNRDNSKK